MRPYYKHDGITLFHGDCREVLPNLAVQPVVTDPPYGIGFASNGQWFRDPTPIAGDGSHDAAEWVRKWAGDEPVVMFFSPYRPMGGWRSVLVWDKGEHVGIGGDRETCWKRDFELIGVSGNGPLAGARDSAVLRHRALLPPPSGHFAEKPERLMRYLIWKINPASIVDPFMGSGTTLVAAKALRLQAFGIDIEERNCEIAARRLAQEVLPLGAEA